MTVHTGAEGDEMDVLGRCANEIAAVLCECCTVEEIEGTLSAIHPDDWKRAAEKCLEAANHRGAVSLTDDELQCLTCAMAGNFPERFEPIRADLLRKLFKAYPYAGGQS